MALTQSSSKYGRRRNQEYCHSRSSLCSRRTFSPRKSRQRFPEDTPSDPPEEHSAPEPAAPQMCQEYRRPRLLPHERPGRKTARRLLLPAPRRGRQEFGVLAGTVRAGGIVLGDYPLKLGVRQNRMKLAQSRRVAERRILPRMARRQNYRANPCYPCNPWFPSLRLCAFAREIPGRNPFMPLPYPRGRTRR